MTVVGVVRAAAIGLAALAVLLSSESRSKKSSGAASPPFPPAGAREAAPTRAEVSEVQRLAKKLVEDLERVHSDTEAMIAARVKAEQARQKAEAAELAAKEKLAEAGRRLKESEGAAEGTASRGGSTQKLGSTDATSLLGRTAQQIVGLCLVVGLLLATRTVPTESDEPGRSGTAVAAAWLAYAFAMVVACLYA